MKCYTKSLQFHIERFRPQLLSLRQSITYLRRLDEKLDRLGGEVGDLRAEVSQRLARIEDELLVLNGIALRLERREVQTTGLKACSTGTSARSPC
jgi:hypothetical protein